MSQVDYSNHFVGPGYYDPYPLDSHWVKKSFNVRLNSNSSSAASGPPKRRNSFSMGVPPPGSSGSMSNMNKQQKGIKGKGASRPSMEISAIDKQPETSTSQQPHNDLIGADNGDALIDFSSETVHVGEHVAINKVIDTDKGNPLPVFLVLEAVYRIINSMTSTSLNTG